MDKAIIFKTEKVVDAYDVLNGLYDRNLEFMDLERKNRVIFVKSSKNHGRPYFKRYLALVEFKNSNSEKKRREDYNKNKRHYKNSEWHNNMQEKACLITDGEKEFRIYNEDKTKYKMCDVFLDKKKTCLELQHSFIDLDFEERNDFYKKLGLNPVWLYDLSRQSLEELGNNRYSLLEHNDNGFFRIANDYKNLIDIPVFIYCDNGYIYRVNELERDCNDDETKATRRYFTTDKKYSVEEFFILLKELDIDFMGKEFLEKNLISIKQAWNKDIKSMILQDIDDKSLIRINRGYNGDIYKDYHGYIYQYVEFNIKNRKYYVKNKNNHNGEYTLSREKMNSNMWVIIDIKR